MVNKKKIISDPVYGFINIPFEIVFELIEHSLFQRQRHLAQLGLVHLVYPGALHTRFSHALGSMHLMTLAINVLKSKGCVISEEEEKAVTITALLNGIGHGPYSHILAKTLLNGIPPRFLTELLMDKLNHEINNKLDLAIKIHRNQYHRKFFHQLVSSQVDMNRLDALIRDSFFTGVTEGVIGYDRILSMLSVFEDELVVEEKGIYSIEKFIIAERLMFGQVYFHKAVVAAECLLVNILKRATHLASIGKELFSSEALKKFLYNTVTMNDFMNDSHFLENFLKLDDFDIFVAIKEWATNDDKTLSLLSQNLCNRNLYKIKMHNHPFNSTTTDSIKKSISLNNFQGNGEVDYFIFGGSVKNDFKTENNLKILFKDGKTKYIAEKSDNIDITTLFKPIEKYYLCYPKELNIVD